MAGGKWGKLKVIFAHKNWAGFILLVSVGRGQVADVSWQMAYSN